MKGRAGDRKRSPANRTLFGPVDHNQNKLDVNRIWTRLNERARTRVVDPNTDEDLGGGGTRGELTGVGSTDAEEGSGGGGGVDDVRTRTREVSPSSELLGIGPGAGGQEFVLRSGTSDAGRRERGPQSSAEKSLISRRLVGSKPTCVTMLPDTSSSPSSSSPSSSSSSSITTATRTSSATTSLLKSSDCPWREPVKQRRSNEASPLQRPSVRSPYVERWRGALQRRPLPPPPAEETEFRRIPVVQLVAGGDGVCPQEAQREKRFFKPIRASTTRRSPEDDDDDEEEEEGGSRDGDGLPATEMTPNRKRKKERGDDDDDDDDDDSDDDDDDDDDGGGGASCRVQSAVRSRSELFGEPGIKSETLSRRLNEFANKNKRTFEDADDDKTPL